ncbi:PQQ-dependent sugar dehydrogenase [Bremerella alba]|uniref:Glucose/Sorbosone dehydrogenase domain-containing protein n=1 Tax=Bremerella alba TaxID=980252 RepID=A0A7V9A5L3_9BACT|nr:PQQ-dependent sugar dehydrogenase [Bremerella alba]MBA2113480.1 hypothetical protein [Bremerella alba]
MISRLNVVMVAVCLGGWMTSFVAAQSANQSQSGTQQIPQDFSAVDTSHLMQSPDPVPLEKERIFPNLKFQRPVEVTSPEDGTNRLFVVEQEGTIRVFEYRDDVENAELFLDLHDVTLRKGNEEGLLGLAFHPKFQENGQFFVYYSTQPRTSVVSRFTVSKDNPNQADRQSEEIVFKLDQPFSNHNGGSIRFGPDGYLYVGLGDGGDAHDPFANGQNLETLLGSILRIDVDRKDKGRGYAIPQDNPFVEREDARGEIWAYGLRNPWRISFDRENGDLWTGDVGQNRFEEVNRIVKGGNYGWNKREGMHSFEPQSPAKETELIDPLAEYFRNEGISVTGGVVYRGPTLKEYDGAYFYADYVSGNVWDLRADGNTTTSNRRVAETGLQISAFGEDQNGEMLLCSFDGHLYRLTKRDIDFKAAKKNFPQKLSETGLFDSVAKNIPAQGVIPYELNMPFWSDYTVKDRYVALPKDKSVVYHERDQWEFPVGTVFVKTFWMHQDRAQLEDPRRLETRLLVHSPDGWQGYTYVYHDDQSEATLLEGSALKPLPIKTAEGSFEQRYYFPSRSDCMACHTKEAGFVLGLNSRQMNHPLDYHGQRENQLAMLNRLNVFTQPLSNNAEEIERFPEWQFGNLDRSNDPQHVESALETPQGETTALARAWLDVNCAVCHRPDGIAPGKRHLQFHADLAKMNLLNQQPLQGQMTPPGGTVVKPGQPYLSELLIRAAHRGVRQMPPLASNVADPRGIEVLRKWIEQMEQPTE